MEISTDAWAQPQWGGRELGDRRLMNRAVAMGRAMARQPAAALPAQRADPVARRAYRFLNNARISPAPLWQPHIPATRQAASQSARVLLVQDRTTLDFSQHPATNGLGPVGARRQRGFFLQSVLAIQPEAQQVLGLAYGQLIVRPEPPTAVPVGQRRGRAEGQAWETAVRALGSPPAGVTWIHGSARASAEAVEWVRLTSWPVTTAASARQVTDWYECRWLVEAYQPALKTGCRIEHSQLDHAADLHRLLGFLVPLAVRLLQLRQAARHPPAQVAPRSSIRSGSGC